MDDLICSVKKKERDLTIDSLEIAEKPPVRDVLILTPRDMVATREGQYVFKMSYRLGNEGFLGAKDFENLSYFHDKVVSKQHGLALGPNENKTIEDKVSLDLKDGTLLVRVDAFSRITEDDETNNDISTMILFRGFQKNAPREPHLHIEALRIAKKAPVQKRLKLVKKQAKSEKKGRFSFNVEFIMRNFGIEAAEDFSIAFKLNGKSFFRHKNLTLAPGESQIVQVPVYFPIVNGKLSVHMDDEAKYPKGPSCKQVIATQLYFQGFHKNTPL